MNSDYDKDLYGILGVSQHADAKEIKSAWRNLMKVDHPDKPGNSEREEVAKDYNLAWSILQDPRKRAEYDAYRRSKRRGASSAPGSGAASAGRADSTPPKRAQEAPVQQHRITLTPREAREGGSVLSIYRASEAGHLTLQTITLPPGLSDGAIYTLPPDNRGRYLRLDIEIVVVAEQEPEPEPEPQQPRRPAPEAEADEEPWHWPWIAAAAVGVVVVLGAGTFGWSQFRGDDASALDAAGQGQGESDGQVPPPSTPTPTLTPSASPSPSPTPLEPGDGTPLVDEVVATKNVVRGFSPGVYVPQLGAHCSQLESADLYREGGGYGADGAPEDYPSGLTDQDILGFHRQVGVHLAQPVALIQDASPTNCGTDTLWVSLADEQKATAAEIQAWCESWAFPEGECIPRQVSGEMVEQARWVPYTLLSDSNDVTIEVPWTMAAVQDDRTSFIDRDAPVLLTHRLFTDPQQAPTVASSVDFLRDGGGEPWVEETKDGGYAVSGVNRRGDVYYRRVYPRPGGTTVLTWWYPESAKATWNPAVDHVSDTFVPAG